MELLLICPRCRTKLSLASRVCHCCGASLNDLLPQERHYIVVKSARAEPPDVSIARAPLQYERGEPMAHMEYNPDFSGPDTSSLERHNVSLCEALDRILTKGAVLFGEVLISVADIDLIYLGLEVILASMETARGLKPAHEGGFNQLSL